MTKTESLPEAWSDSGWSKRRELIAKLPIRVRSLLAAECAAVSLPLWAAIRSPDHRPALAIEASLVWVGDPSATNKTSSSSAAAAAAAASAVASAAYAASAADAASAAAYAAAHAADAAYAAACAAYAAYASADAAADAAAHAAAHAAADDRQAKWKWLYLTFKRCKGPKYPFVSEWRTTEAVALAQGMWSRRRADCLPILADALEDAGLTDQAVLQPMREEPDTACLSEWAIWNLLEFGKYKTGKS